MWKKILLYVGFMFAGSFMFMGGIAIVVHQWEVSGGIGMFMGGVGMTFALFGTTLLTPVILKAYEKELADEKKQDENRGP